MEILDLTDSLPRHAARKFSRRNVEEIDHLVIHCTDNDKWGPEETAGYHISPNCHISKGGCPAICYTFFIRSDGRIFQTLVLEEVGWHAGPKMNRRGLGIVIQYRATDAEEPPNDDIMESLMELLKLLKAQLGIKTANIIGHREVLSSGYKVVKGKKVLLKECPGMLIDLNQIRDLLAEEE